MELAGQAHLSEQDEIPEDLRKLGAQLLLSEVLEYIIMGLGVTPIVDGLKIKDANSLQYEIGADTDRLEMLDGLADVAYTMYWNMHAFSLKLEDAFKRVCDNNLKKFVLLEDWHKNAGPLERSEWDLGRGISWPAEVVQVEVLRVNNNYYAVGKDRRGKVRKPSTYARVDLGDLV